MAILSGDVDWGKAKGDLALSFGSQLFAKLVGYVLLAVLARHLDRESFGQFLYATTAASLLVLLTDPGTQRYLVREAATSQAEALERFSQVLSLRLPLYLPYFALVAAFGAFFRPEILGVLLLSSLYIGLHSLWGSAAALLLGLRRVGFVVTASGSSQLLLLSVVLALVAWGTQLLGLLWGYVVTYALLLALGLLFLRQRVGVFGLRSRRTLAPVVRAALPLFLLDLLGVAHFKVDTLMLGFFRPYEEVALYEGAARLLEASQFVVRPLLAIFLPLCAGLAAGGRWSELERLAQSLLRWAAGLGTLIAGGVLIAASPALTLVYGRGFEAAAPLLRILYVATPLLYLSFVSLFVGNALHLERKALGVALASVLANVGLNAVFIPPLGATGAALTTVVTHVMLAALLVRAIRQGLRLRSGGANGLGADRALS